MSIENEVAATAKRKPGRAKGQISAVPSKVITPDVTRAGNGFKIVVPFNDSTGKRQVRTIILTVIKDDLKVVAASNGAAQ